MVLFGKREVVFKVQGDKARWKAARAAVETAGIQIMEASSYEGEIPLCSRIRHDVVSLYIVLQSAAQRSMRRISPGLASSPVCFR